MGFFLNFLPKVAKVFAFLIFLFFFSIEAYSGPSVRHGLRQHKHHDMHHGSGHVGKGSCPQLRFTELAPDGFLELKNPLTANSENLIAGEAFFHTDAQPTACKICHGLTGNGMGMMAPGLNPPPRNFTCLETMKKISDGQMFWVIRNGSSGTGMPAYQGLGNKHIWQLILYLRTLSK